MNKNKNAATGQDMLNIFRRKLMTRLTEKSAGYSRSANPSLSFYNLNYVLPGRKKPGKGV
ncbi:MAG: hypothetical protein B6245_12025 [Desulfobacteraceae bacterium 4572_88]|nr:MAG: hypothetical protein B6245_12025 [Desulfobacteraceae bacterium 4572_88]